MNNTRSKITFSKEKIKSLMRQFLQFSLNPRLWLCLGIAWVITNGWAYIVLGIGTYNKISWMIALSSGYLALLWFPFTPEKIITVSIAMILLKFLFPNDEKTLKILKQLYSKAKNAIKRKNNR